MRHLIRYWIDLSNVCVSRGVEGPKCKMNIRERDVSKLLWVRAGLGLQSENIVRANYSSVETESRQNGILQRRTSSHM